MKQILCKQQVKKKTEAEQLFLQALNVAALLLWLISDLPVEPGQVKISIKCSITLLAAEA